MKQINIAEILRDVKIGTKLYSPALGVVILDNVSFDKEYPIGVLDADNDPWELDQYGRISEYGECMLFPSKNMRDWSKFTIRKEYEFKPFDKVLVRDTDEQLWGIELFAFLKEHDKFPYHCLVNFYKQCIPYNEETKHLLGTTGNWEE